ncbi:midcut-by-XrtH protein [Ottowia thiooxydans]|uniref:midcut-by-XrtH protein n=1 Tax=Ottowia thiooxydans TaxID=219182 RepID=UPI00048FCD69|nr:midcut-by-XrtH protein [Ottowia thiooxydans]
MLISTRRHSRGTRWLATASLAVFTCAAQAQVPLLCNATLAYAPIPVPILPPAAVPSFTFWGLLILASMLGFMGVRRVRLGGSAKHWAVLFGLAFVLAAGSGGLVINQAMAAAASMSSATGGSVPITALSTTLTNTTTVPLKISSLIASGGQVAAGSTCQIGQSLAPSAGCIVALEACVEAGSPGGGGGQPGGGCEGPECGG